MSFKWNKLIFDSQNFYLAHVVLTTNSLWSVIVGFLVCIDSQKLSFIVFVQRIIIVNCIVKIVENSLNLEIFVYFMRFESKFL